VIKEEWEFSMHKNDNVFNPWSQNEKGRVLGDLGTLSVCRAQDLLGSLSA
jgi:hypothetical protein